MYFYIFKHYYLQNSAVNHTDYEAIKHINVIICIFPKVILEDFIRNSDSLIDLEKKLNDFGVNFKGCKDYATFLSEEWERISFGRGRKIINSSTKEVDDLPTLIVKDDYVRYYIHGVVHGWPFYLAPGWHPRKKFKDFVNKKVKTYWTPVFGEQYFYEERFNKLFHLLKSQELKDVSKLRNKPNPFLKELGLVAVTPLACIFGLITYPLMFTSAYITSKLIKEPEDTLQNILFLEQKALSDERYQKKFFEFFINREMPQPLDLEKQYLLEKKSKSRFILKALARNPHMKTTPERSLWTARELIKYAHNKNLNYLHYIGGLGHSTQIAYFLKHPNYSFEKLDKHYFKK